MGIYTASNIPASNRSGVDLLLRTPSGLSQTAPVRVEFLPLSPALVGCHRRNNLVLNVANAGTGLAVVDAPFTRTRHTVLDSSYSSLFLHVQRRRFGSYRPCLLGPALHPLPPTHLSTPEGRRPTHAIPLSLLRKAFNSHLNLSSLTSMGHHTLYAHPILPDRF